MARSRVHRAKRPKGAKRGQPGKKFRVKPHTRTPRGPNQGKSAVRVPGYSRRAPRRR